MRPLYSKIFVYLRFVNLFYYTKNLVYKVHGLRSLAKCQFIQDDIYPNIYDFQIKTLYIITLGCGDLRVKKALFWWTFNSPGPGNFRTVFITYIIYYLYIYKYFISLGFSTLKLKSPEETFKMFIFSNIVVWRIKIRVLKIIFLKNIENWENRK